MTDSATQVDRGWAWMIVLGSCGLGFLVSSIIRTVGILYTEILEVFNVTPVAASWIPSLVFFFMFALSPAAGCVTNKFSNRTTAILGSVCGACGLVLSSFVYSLDLLYICFGLLLGIGSCFILNSAITVVPGFFNKRLALANALAGSGAAAGGIVGPIFIRYLLDEFGFRGCCLILGGLYLNMLPFAFLFRSKRLCKQVARKAQILQDTTYVHCSNEEYEENVIVVGAENDGGYISGKLPEEKDHLSVNYSRVPAPAQSALYYTPVMGASHQSLTVISKNSKTSINDTSDNENGPSRSPCCCCGEPTKIFEWTLLKNKSFIPILLATGFAYPFFAVLIPMILPSHSLLCGLSKSQVALVVTIGPCADPFLRPFIGWVTDLKKFSSVHLWSSGFVLLAAIFYALPFICTFELLVVFSVLHGSLAGMMYSLVTVVLVHEVGGDSIASSISICMLFEALLNLTLPPFLSMLFEISGSWTSSIFVCASATLVGFIIIAVHLFLRSRRKHINNVIELSSVAS